MRKHKRKSYEVDVWQVGVEEAPAWVREFTKKGVIKLTKSPLPNTKRFDTVVMVKHEGQTSIARHGDFIVKELLGEVVVVRPEHFYFLYEEAFV